MELTYVVLIWRGQYIRSQLSRHHYAMARFPHPYEWDINDVFAKALKYGPFPTLRTCAQELPALKAA
jgi:hypothetical protein